MPLSRVGSGEADGSEESSEEKRDEGRRDIYAKKKEDRLIRERGIGILCR